MCVLLACSGYVIVAWIWSAIWYVLLDPIKWAMCYILNEDGFRDMVAYRKDAKHRLETISKDKANAVEGPAGMVPPTYANPLGRASLSKPISAVLDRQSAAVVAVKRDSGGIARVSNDPVRAVNIARRSLVKKSMDKEACIKEETQA